jgi:DNA polymerase sigma
LSRQTASLMPSPPPEIVEVVGQFIQDIFHCSGLTKEDLEIRRAATENLRKMIEMAFPGYSIRPYGSVVTGTFTRKKKCLTSYKYLLYIILIFV